MGFDRDAYLSRVGLSDLPPAGEEGLRALHQAQFFAIPFENFDIQLGRSIRLDADHLFDKLVRRKRGGYCFELNGLMLTALTALGFAARPLLARVHLHGDPGGRTHQLNLVEIGDRPWIIDVGFGAGGLRCPLPLETGREEHGPGWAFRLVAREPWGMLMQSREDGIWKDSYSFDLSHVTPGDIAMGNHYTSTSPASHFVTSRVASRPLATGRVSLRNHTLTRLEAGDRTEQELSAGSSYLAELAGTFGVELDATYADLKPLPDGAESG